MFMPVLAVIYGGINALKNKLALLSGILCIGLVIAFIFYTGKDNQKKKGYTTTGFAMGTAVTVSVYSDQGRQDADAVIDCVSRLEREQISWRIEGAEYTLQSLCCQLTKCLISTDRKIFIDIFCIDMSAVFQYQSGLFLIKWNFFLLSVDNTILVIHQTLYRSSVQDRLVEDLLAIFFLYFYVDIIIWLDPHKRPHLAETMTFALFEKTPASLLPKAP